MSDPASSPPRPALVELDIAKLRFDPTNPRLVGLLGPRPRQDQIRRALIDYAHADYLIPSLMENGYLPYEPLVVRPEKRGTHVVLEGNRRLAAVLALRDSSDEAERRAFQERELAHLPCVVFAGNRDQELAYQGLRHITATRDWPPSARGAYLEQILQSGKSLAEAGRMVSVATPGIRDALLVRRLLERARELGVTPPETPRERELLNGYLGDAIRRTNIRLYLQITEHPNPLHAPSVNDTRLKNLITWLSGNPQTGESPRITTIWEIPILDQALGHPDAARAFEEGESAVDAAEQAGAEDDRMRALLSRAKVSAELAAR